TKTRPLPNPTTSRGARGSHTAAHPHAHRPASGARRFPRQRLMLRLELREILRDQLESLLVILLIDRLDRRLIAEAIEQRKQLLQLASILVLLEPHNRTQQLRLNAQRDTDRISRPITKPHKHLI